MNPDRPSPGGTPGEVGGRAPTRARWPAAVPLVCLLIAAKVSAQDLAGTLASCQGRVISEVVVTAREPSLPNLPSQLRWVERAVSGLHSTTDTSVVEAFLLLAEGETCTEERRAESERVLRLQPFLADATVRAVPDGRGGARIEVETLDEISPELRVRFRGAQPSAVRLGSGNVAGRGLALSASVERGFAYRPGLSFTATAYQVLGRPYVLSLVLDHRPLGGARSLSLAYPFFTDLQRSAWYVGYDEVDRYVPFARPTGEDLSLQLQRRSWALGGVRRMGIGRETAFVGALVTHEDVDPAAYGVIISDSGLVADTTGALDGSMPSYRNVRLNAVFGARLLSFTQARGLDALSATQDVATGVQLGALIGRGLPRFGSVAGDLFVSADLYAGLGTPRSLATLRISAEGRRDQAIDRWDSMVGSGRLAWYVKPDEAHVLVSTLEVAGAWRSRIPFQLRLGDLQAGVRGYGRSRAGGAVRGVGRLEHRWLLGNVGEHAGIGVSSFVDVGRVWAGDALIGADSRLRMGAGLGLLVAVPPQSRRLWRLDLAVPLGSDPDARWQVRLSGLRTGPFWRESDDIARVRADASPSTIFTWW